MSVEPVSIKSDSVNCWSIDQLSNVS